MDGSCHISASIHHSLGHQFAHQNCAAVSEVRSQGGQIDRTLCKDRQQQHFNWHGTGSLSLARVLVNQIRGRIVNTSLTQISKDHFLPPSTGRAGW